MPSIGNVELGMPTLLDLPQVDDCAVQCAKLGLRFVELNMNLPEYQMHRVDERRIAVALDAYGVYCTLHLDENINICDFNPLVSRAYLETALSAIALARRNRMPTLTMHMNNGVSFALPSGRVPLYERYSAFYLEALRTFRDQCEDAIAGSGVRICVENTGGFPEFAQRGIELLLESEAFGLTLDVGHSQCAGDVDMPFFDAHRDRLWHMHLHDATGTDCHLPLGEGEIDIQEKLRLAESRGCRAVLEVKTMDGIKRSVAFLRG